MQIDFTPKKLQEAKEYVNLLKNPKNNEDSEKIKTHKESTFKKIFKFLFR